MKPLKNYILFFVILFGCLTTCFAIDNNNSNKRTKEGIKDKLTDDQISEHLDFWIGKWGDFDKSTNQIIASIELKWKEEGKSLESKGIIFEGGEQKDKFKGSISYDKKLGVFVDVQTSEASGETFIRHSILNLETQSEHGFPIKPEPPEDIDIKFTYKKVNQNNVDYTFEVLREGETLEKRESIIKRQGVEPKEGDPKADLPKLTAEQIVDHLEFWIGKWEGYDKSSNEIYDKFESKWKEKGKSLAFEGIAFEDGEQKDTYKGSSHYDKDLNVFVDTVTFENTGVTYRRHSVLDPKSGISNGFSVLPKLPEDIELKFEWKKVNQNNVDYTFKALRGDEILEHKEFIVKRQIDKPKAAPEIIKQREELTTNLITSMGEFADALAGIEDKKSALEAAAKFGGIAEKLEALAMKMEVLGFPEGSQAEEINSQMTKFEKEMQQKMNKSISPILVNEELNDVLMPALMKFGERMDKLTPVMEKWAGKKRPSDPPKEEIALEAPKVEEVNSETLITLSVDGKEVTAERNIEGFPEFDFFYITSSGAFSVDEIRIGKTYDSVTQKSISDDEENILFHDSFEYATGEKLINQESWYSEGLPRHISNSADTYTVSEGSLFNDKIKSIGNRVSAVATAEISGIGIDLPDTVSFAPGDNVYISFLIRPEGVIGEGVWGGYFSFGAKPFVGKGILFGKPGDSSAPDDKKFAIDKQGGPIIKTSGVEVEVGKTSHVVVRLESKILDEPTEDESDENNDLKKNIVGKLIGFEPNEGRLQFNDNGVMMFGLGADPKDVGLTYQVKGNEVLVFQRGKRDGGILFPSLNPKVGDEIEFGPDANKRKVTITKIKSANKAGGEPESLQDEKKLKDFPDDFRELTPEEVIEYFEILIGKWESVDTSNNKILERTEGKWKEKGKSIQFNGIGYQDGKPFRNYSAIVYYDKDLRVFIQKLTYKKSGTTYTRHWIWDPEKREAYGIAVDPKPPVEIEVKYQYTQKSADSGQFIFEVIKDGESIERKECLLKRKEFILEKVDIEDVPLKIEKKPKLSVKQLAEQMSESLKSKIGNLKSLRDVADKAKKAKAMNEVILLNNAIKMYELDYGKLPIKDSEKIQAKDLAVNTLSGNLLSVLSGHNTDGLNPRKLAFYQGKEAKDMDSKKPKGGVFGTVDCLQLADPWGNPYFIVFDSNYDGFLKGLPGSRGKNIARNVVIWSTGGSEDFEKFDPDKWIRSWSK